MLEGFNPPYKSSIRILSYHFEPKQWAPSRDSGQPSVVEKVERKRGNQDGSWKDSKHCIFEKDCEVETGTVLGTEGIVVWCRHFCRVEYWYLVDSMHCYENKFGLASCFALAN